MARMAYIKPSSKQTSKELKIATSYTPFFVVYCPPGEKAEKSFFCCPNWWDFIPSSQWFLQRSDCTSCGYFPQRPRAGTRPAPTMCGQFSYGDIYSSVTMVSASFISDSGMVRFSASSTSVLTTGVESETVRTAMVVISAPSRTSAAILPVVLPMAT